MGNLVITMTHGIRIAVPADLNAITTYVLLEQEQWFEREIDFIRAALTPGTTAIDIGANLGIYTLTMAQVLGPTGRVYAFEPAAEVRASLEYSRDLNGFANVTVIGAALADMEKEGWLDHGDSSELNAIGEDAADSGSDGTARRGERIRISTLDLQEAEQGWDAPDFIKIDAEGAEALILAGAPRFFADHSPLVMYEVKAGMSHNVGLQQLFIDRGYATYRQLGTTPLLVPSPAGATLDGFELNLFACKPDRAARLAAADLLVETPLPYAPTAQDRRTALALFTAQPFAASLPNLVGSPETLDPRYLDALAAYAAWRDTTRPAAARYGALLSALEGVRALAAEPGAPATRISTFARIAAEAGERVTAIGALNQLLTALSRGDVLSIAEPFWPALAQFDGIDPGSARFSDWFVTQVAETMERSCAYSSLFGGAPVDTAWLAALPFASTEMERRRVLKLMRNGERPPLPPLLATAAPDHLNAGLWQAILAEPAPAA